MELNDYLERLLSNYKKLSKKDMSERRMAVKPLYDFYQRLLLEVGVKYFHLPQDTLLNYGLQSRWSIVKKYLEVMKRKTNDWDKIVRDLQKIRRSNEHNDFFDPDKKVLETAFERASQFIEYLLSAGEEYIRQSEGLTVIDQYRRITREYSMRTSMILRQYGSMTPESVKQDLHPRDSKIYSNFVPMRDTIQGRIPELKSIRDLSGDDLNLLFTLVREVERIDARENAYIQFGVCPRCGGKIVETERYLGGNEDEPPDAVHVRIGCNKCEFNVIDETMDI
jgi:hypothetical protein